MPPRIMTPTDSYVFHYPQADKFFQDQEDIHWFKKEIDVEKDIHSIKTELTEAEQHAVTTVLKLFTLYELMVGHEYWSGTIAKIFPRPEIQKMATYFAHIELGVHAPFYAEINKALGLDHDEFYTDYVNDPELEQRMAFLEEHLTKTRKNPLLGLALFSMVEGVVLYSSFAFLKHFESQGKNKLSNIVAGINFSVRDEQLHAHAAAWLFRTLLEESNLTEQELAHLKLQIERGAADILGHEKAIIAKLFERGQIEGVTANDLTEFVKHRINVCMVNLGLEEEQELGGSIKGWFYKGVSGYIFHDFFSKQGREYSRDWAASKFTWRTE